MAKEDKAKAKDDDSMEDILHSIRDIVSGDEPPEEEPIAEEKAEMAEPEKKEEAPAAEEEVLELTEEVKEEKPATEPVAETPPAEEKKEEVPAEAAPAAEGDVLEEIDEALGEEGKKEGEAAAPAAEPAPVTEAPKEAAAPQEETKAEAPAAEPAKDDAEKNKDDKLVREDAAKATTESMKNLVKSVPKKEIDSPEMRSGSTVEDLVVEALKPMLSEWLSDNLPTIVRQIVEKEVKKLVPRDEE